MIFTCTSNYLAYAEKRISGRAASDCVCGGPCVGRNLRGALLHGSLRSAHVWARIVGRRTCPLVENFMILTRQV